MLNSALRNILGSISDLRIYPVKLSDVLGEKVS